MLQHEFTARTTKRFTLQWHLTQACDLSCKHCYDRSKVSVLRLEDSKLIVDELVRFCEERDVDGSIVLSGGNPLFYPWFFELYEYIAQQRVGNHPLGISILGNPISRVQLERIVAIRKPRIFQVSLEGLREHNDRIRGEGFFDRVLEFLPLLKEFGVHGNVMLTLTRDNMEQVVPLGRLLRGKVPAVTFNRLAEVGEGASLNSPDIEEYGEFMIEYMKAAQENPVLRIKDNLFNIFRDGFGQRLYRGCTGYGCGAAFNFLAVLPDGSAHACRKFPSPLGKLSARTLGDVYDSALAEHYRCGATPCAGCQIRASCGSCMAVVAGRGGDPFKDLDPHCFMNL